MLVHPPFTAGIPLASSDLRGTLYFSIGFSTDTKSSIARGYTEVFLSVSGRDRYLYILIATVSKMPNRYSLTTSPEVNLTDYGQIPVKVAWRGFFIDQTVTACSR